MKPAVGIGVDIENIERFTQVAQDPHHPFFERVFTAAERDYCFGHGQPAPHLAVRFAGKEAVIKALSSLGRPVPALNQIELSHNEQGVPRVNLTVGDPLDIHISLSHSGDNALAFALVFAHGS